MLGEVEPKYLDPIVWAAEKPKRYEVQPRLWGFKHILRHLWLLRATDTNDVFQKEGELLVEKFREDPPVFYQDFADDLKTKLETPYEMPKGANPELKQFLRGNVDLPVSAQSFVTINSSGHTRKIPDFKSSVRKKIASDFPWQKLHGIGKYPTITLGKDHKEELFALLDEVAEDDAEIFTAVLKAYASVGGDLLGLIEETIDRIKRLPPLKQKEGLEIFLEELKSRRSDDSDSKHTDPEVYYGRDSVWLYLARKANQLSAEQKSRLYYLVASRNIIQSDVFRRYILGHNIPFDAYHIDTLTNDANGVRRVLEILTEDREKPLSEKEFIERGRFITTTQPHLEQHLFPERDIHELWEEVSDQIELKIPGGVPWVFRVQQNGNLEPEFYTTSFGGGYYIEKLKAWAMEQAVIRHFLPKEEQ